MSYQHTQRAPLYLILLAIAGLLLANAWVVQEDRLAPVILLVLAVAFCGLAFMFRQLTIADRGDHLALQYGPLPFFGTTIRYDDIESAERSRSAFIDGWGMHYIPGRGVTYNLWGFDCVKLMVKGRTIRVGSDDADALAELVSSKLKGRQE